MRAKYGKEPSNGLPHVSFLCISQIQERPLPRPPPPLPPSGIPRAFDEIFDPNQSSKIQTYREVKTIDDYRCKDYPHKVTNIRHRTTMTKLRLSNHRLAIQTGRYMRPNKKPNERICPLCKKEAKAEKHFLFSCPI